jgi:3-oxoadipate enol-lactonase
MRQHPPTLLFIHGFPLDRKLWSPQLQGLDGDCRMLAPDLRGFGEDRRPLPEVMGMDDHARDLKDLLDEREIGRVVLCGLSMGGYVALSFLEKWPERVQGLVLCNTKATADDAEAKAARHAMAEDTRTKGMQVIARAMSAKVLSAATRRERPDLVREVEAMIARQQAAAAAASALGMAGRPDRLALLADVRVPALVITGSDDELMQLPTSEEMARAIPGCRLEVLAGAGHLSNMEAPQAFNEALRVFLQEVAMDERVG